MIEAKHRGAVGVLSGILINIKNDKGNMRIGGRVDFGVSFSQPTVEILQHPIVLDLWNNWGF